MARKKKATAKTNHTTNGAALGYEAELWRMADSLRGSMDAAEYKKVVLGLDCRQLRNGVGCAG